jgi:phage minor structural protein
VDVYILSKDEVLLGIRDDATDFVHNEHEFSVDATFPIDSSKIDIAELMKIGFWDIDNEFQFFEVRSLDKSSSSKEFSIYAENLAMVELLDEVITDKRPSDVMAGMAIEVALEGSDWEVGSVEDTAILSTNYYYETRWSGLAKVKAKWGCYLKFTCTIDDNRITGRYVNVYQRAGANRGKRLEIGRDISKDKYHVEAADLKTALYGRGKGEEVGVTESGDPTYGRRITFKDIVWSTANGDPANKPAGQEYVEDVAATAAYGRNGKPKFDVAILESCEDPTELLRLTWEALQLVNKPKVTVSVTIIDYEALTREEHEAIRYGDTVQIIIDESNVSVEANIVEFSRNYIKRTKSKVSVGNIIPDLPSRNAINESSIARIRESANVGGSVATTNPSLLQGILDTMITRILSTGTNIDTDPLDGGLILVSPGGNNCVKLTGQGILCANAKIAGQWQWRTAIDGNGIVADSIAAGVLRANLIKILGSDQFYWDAQNIYIISPQSSNKQIRIGCYDGTNYGIGFTQDGGATWQNAIGFDGVNFSVTSLQNQVNTQGTALAALNELVTTSFRVTSQGVVVGQSNVPTSVLVAADRVAIRDQHNNEVTKITDNNMEIESATIRKQISVGFVARVKESNGSCSDKWIGAEA